MNAQDSVASSSNEAAIMSKRLLSVLKEYRGRKFVLVEPGGNHGDYLIYKGFHKLAQLAGLDCVANTDYDFKSAKVSSDSVVYIHGCGGYVPLWVGGPESLQSVLSNHRGVVILGPTTFSDDLNYISQVFANCLKDNVSKRIVIFAREQKSLGVLREFMPSYVDIDIDHDTALNLSKEDMLKQNVIQKYKMYGIRGDKEMSRDTIYNYLRWLDPINVCSTFDEWIMFHAQAKEIVTNRTHSSILGSILGIPTTLLPNSYHKNRSIWEYSLQSRGVQWKDQLSGGWINKVIESRGRLRSFFTSSKYRSFRKNLLINFAI